MKKSIDYEKAIRIIRQHVETRRNKLSHQITWECTDMDEIKLKRNELLAIGKIECLIIELTMDHIPD